MHISEFDYDLPEELIAQEPLAQRDASRMLVVDRETKSWRDAKIAELPNYLTEKDVLVRNNTRVFPARLYGQRVPSGGHVELLLVRQIEPNVWEAMTRPARRLRDGAEITFANARLRAKVISSLEDGLRVVKLDTDESLDKVIDDIGEPPLPPYIRREPRASAADRERYQTIYALQRGAIAAPTAGLHFTEVILNQITNRGVRIVDITLHVGYGTFAPVRVEDVEQHQVGAEWFSISESVAAVINNARSMRGRVVAVGTTTARALESAANSDGRITGQSGFSALTILPGYDFRVVDALLTNFHLPRSSLLLLVSALGGRDSILEAYRHAVQERYRFYSYGDCMLIV